MTRQPEAKTMPPVFEKRLAVEENFHCGLYERGSENVLLAAADADALAPFLPAIERCPCDAAVLAFRNGVPTGRTVAVALRILVPLLARYARVTLLGAGIPPALFASLGAAVASSTNILLLESLPEGVSLRELPENTALFYDGTHGGWDAPVREFLNERPGLAVNCPFAVPRMSLALTETGVARSLFLSSPADGSRLREMCGEAATMFAHCAPWSATVIANEFSRKGLSPERMATVKENRSRLLLSPESAEAMEAALASEECNDAEKLFAQAILLGRKGRNVKADKLFCLAALDNPANPFYQAKAASVYAKCELWHDAIKAYKAAIQAVRASTPEYSPLLPDLYFGIAAAVDGLGGKRDAQGFLAIGIALEDEGDKREHALIKGTKRTFVVRRELYRFVRRNLDRIRADAGKVPPARLDALPLPNAPELPNIIFTYWDKGVNHAPELVRNCRRHLLRNNPDSRIIELDDGNIAEYADIPSFIMDRYADGRITNPFFSDILRVFLLERHGGMWLDATCFCLEPLWPRLSRLAKKGLFLFRYPDDPLLMSNWLIAASRGNRVMALMAQALAAYWREYDTVLDYYIFHHILATLTLLDSGTAQAFKEMPFMDSLRAHELQKRMLKPYDDAAFSAVQDLSFVHKLTYKTCADGCREGSYLHRLGLLSPTGENGRDHARG